MPETLEQQVKFFMKNGYCVLKGALEMELVSQLRQAVNEISEGFEVREVPDIIDRHEIFRLLLEHPPVISLFKKLMGPKIQMESVNASRVRPGKGQPVGWHMDNHYYPDPLPPLWYFPNSVNCAYYLDDITPEKGPLAVVPGSHLSGKNPPDGHGPISGEVSVYASAGDAVVFHGALWHCAKPNVSGEERRTLYYNCIQSFCKQRTDHFEGSRCNSIRETGTFDEQQMLGKFDGWHEIPAEAGKR